MKNYDEISTDEVLETDEISNEENEVAEQEDTPFYIDIF